MIQVIKTEIERRIKIQDDWIAKGLQGEDLALAVRLELKQLLSFLSGLESEKQMDLDGLDEEIIRFNMVNRPINHSELGLKQWGEMVARHFAKWGAEHTKKDEIPVSEELLEALHAAAYLPEMEFYGGLKYKLRELYEQLIAQKGND